MNQKKVGVREISRTLKISRNTVRDVIKKGAVTKTAKRTKNDEHIPIIKDLFRECQGNMVRVREELESRHNIVIPYQTLTWLIRTHGICSPKKKKRAGSYVFEPGEEMQHDTSPHKLKLAGVKITAQCASLVLAYSRKIYMQYYPCFKIGRASCRERV